MNKGVGYIKKKVFNTEPNSDFIQNKGCKLRELTSNGQTIHLNIKFLIKVLHNHAVWLKKKG